MSQLTTEQQVIQTIESELDGHLQHITDLSALLDDPAQRASLLYHVTMVRSLMHARGSVAAALPPPAPPKLVVRHVQVPAAQEPPAQAPDRPLEGLSEQLKGVVTPAELDAMLGLSDD